MRRGMRALMARARGPGGTGKRWRITILVVLVLLFGNAESLATDDTSDKSDRALMAMTQLTQTSGETRQKRAGEE